MIRLKFQLSSLSKLCLSRAPPYVVAWIPKRPKHNFPCLQLGFFSPWHLQTEIILRSISKQLFLHSNSSWVIDRFPSDQWKFVGQNYTSGTPWSDHLSLLNWITHSLSLSLSLSLSKSKSSWSNSTAAAVKKAQRSLTKDRLLTRLNDVYRVDLGGVSVPRRGCSDEGSRSRRRKSKRRRRRRWRRREGGGRSGVGESREIACFFSFSLSSSLTSATLRTLGVQGSRPVTLICCASHNESRKLVQRVRYYY